MQSQNSAGAMEDKDIEEVEDESCLTNFVQKQITDCLKISIDLKINLQHLQKQSANMKSQNEDDEYRDRLKIRILKKRRDIANLKIRIDDQKDRIHRIKSKEIKPIDADKEQTEICQTEAESNDSITLPISDGLQESLYSMKLDLKKRLDSLIDDEDTRITERTAKNDLLVRRSELFAIRQKRDHLCKLIQKFRYISIQRVLSYVK